MKNHSMSLLARFGLGVIAGVMVLLPFHAVFTTWLGATFGHIDAFRIWKEIVAAILLFLCLIVLARQPKLRQRVFHDRLAQLIVIYGFVLALAGIWALHRGSVNREALLFGWIIDGRFLLFFIVAWILSQITRAKLNWQRLVFVPAVVVIAFGLMQLLVLPANVLTHVGYGPKTIPAYQTVDQKPDYVRLQSTLRGPNPLGAYLVFIITVLIVLGFTQPRRQRLWFSLATAAGIVLIFTYSRSAWIGVIASAGAALLLIIRSDRSRRFVLFGLLGLAIVAAGLVVAFRHNRVVENSFFHTDETSIAQSSNQGRAEALKQGLRDIVHEPQGRGPGTAGPASFRNNHPARIAENFFIQIGQEVGILGLGLFVAINLIVAKRLYARRSDPLALSLLASLVGISIINLLLHAWSDDTISLLWWGLAGVALAGA